MVDNRRGELRPEFIVDRGAGELARRFLQLLAELLGGLFPSGKADDRDGGGKCTLGGKVIERGDELAVGEIAGRAENDECAGLG